VIIRKSEAEIEGMARAGALLADTLAYVREHLEPGIEMRELDRIADEYIESKGGYPTSKGYKGFPAALCISPNSMVVHGIPGTYRAREGDLISLDLGITLDGLVADSAVTLPVGEISPEAQRLLDVCLEALGAGIEGMVEELSRDAKGYATQVRGFMPGIPIVIDGPSRQWKVSTQPDGWFRLWGLQSGEYHVKPVLPKGFVNITSPETVTLAPSSCTYVRVLATPPREPAR